MSDSHKNHKHTKAHWGQAFEPDEVEEVAGEDQVSTVEALVSDEVKPIQEKLVDETPIVLPAEDTGHLERLYVEGLELLKLEDSTLKSYVKNLFRKKSPFEEVGKVYTKEGRELAVVINTRGEKFARYDIYEKGQGDTAHGPARSAYLPFKLVQPFFRK